MSKRFGGQNLFMAYYVLHYVCFCLLYVLNIVFVKFFFWCPCVAINVSVRYNGALLPDIILLTQCYYHRGISLNAMKRFWLCSLSMIPPQGFDIFPLCGMLRRSKRVHIFL